MTTSVRRLGVPPSETLRPGGWSPKYESLKLPDLQVADSVSDSDIQLEVAATGSISESDSEAEARRTHSSESRHGHGPSRWGRAWAAHWHPDPWAQPGTTAGGTANLVWTSGSAGITGTKGQECNTGAGGSATWGASHWRQIATQGAGPPGVQPKLSGEACTLAQYLVDSDSAMTWWI